MALYIAHYKKSHNLTLNTLNIHIIFSLSHKFHNIYSPFFKHMRAHTCTNSQGKKSYLKLYLIIINEQHIFILYTHMFAFGYPLAKSKCSKEHLIYKFKNINLLIFLSIWRNNFVTRLITM